MQRRAGSRNVADEIGPLLQTIGIRSGARILHVQLLGDPSSDSLICERLWFTSGKGTATPGRVASLERREEHASGLPFGTGQFDFAVCVGVVERLANPAPFCAELARTARAGYLECRRGIAQILQPDPTIRWLVDHECDTLFLREADHAEAVVLEGLRRRIHAKRSIEESIDRLCDSARLRPLMFAEVLWTGRFKYRVVRATER